MNDICVKCAVELKCVKNGGYVKLVTRAQEYFYRADLHCCPKCGHQIVKGISKRVDHHPAECDPIFVVITDGHGWEG